MFWGSDKSHWSSQFRSNMFDARIQSQGCSRKHCRGSPWPCIRATSRRCTVHYVRKGEGWAKEGPPVHILLMLSHSCTRIIINSSNCIICSYRFYHLPSELTILADPSARRHQTPTRLSLGRSLLPPPAIHSLHSHALRPMTTFCSSLRPLAGR